MFICHEIANNHAFLSIGAPAKLLAAHVSNQQIPVSSSTLHVSKYLYIQTKNHVTCCPKYGTWRTDSVPALTAPCGFWRAMFLAFHLAYRPQ